MAIIDPVGLFTGRRLRACSDKARLMWPYFFLGANGFGRIEIDYDNFVRNIFVDFRNFPKSSEIFGILREYHENGLMFIYRVPALGQVWGQFDCKNGSLPRYTTRKDKQSPAPDEEAFILWKKECLLKTKTLPNISEIFGNFPEISHGEERRGVGVGEVLERSGEKHTPLPPSADASGESVSDKPISKAAMARELERKQTEWFEAWWKTVWRKHAKEAARRSWLKLVRDEETFAAVTAGTEAQLPELLSREPQFRPMVATWLNQRRWEDELGATPQQATLRVELPEWRPAQTAAPRPPVSEHPTIEFPEF